MGGPGVRPRPEDYAHANEFHTEHQRAGYEVDGRCTICFAPLRDEVEQPLPEDDRTDLENPMWSGKGS